MSYTKKDNGYYTVIENEGGATLGVKSVAIIEKDGLAFKDHAGTGELLPYEDWRLDPTIRARDLADRLSIQEIAGLTLFSSHQQIPAPTEGRFYGSYDGKRFNARINDYWQLTDQQKRFVAEDGIRTVLVTKIKNIETVVKWNNAMQDLAEQSSFGIPISFSSDPRHGIQLFSERGMEDNLLTSKWPDGLGLAATFTPETVYDFARVVSTEYRAMGITRALSPQIDLGTEPRWNRINQTFGTHTQMVVDMAKAYCDGLQTTEGSADGWGRESVAAMVKHWPGGGTGEGGRDAHFAYGKYAVYPGNNMAEHMKPFTEGAFKLDGGTKKSAAVMPYYTISTDQDVKYGENVGNSYSRYIIKDLLRDSLDYDGIICTDWGVTKDPDKVNSFARASHGVEEMPRPERLLKIIMNGVDQFGGDNEVAPVIAAYELGVEQYGEEVMKARMAETAYRIVLPLFRTGLFENPYLTVDESAAVIANREFCKAGYDAQVKSLVMLKNKNQVLPLDPKTKIYIPDRFIKGGMDFFGAKEEDKHVKPVMPDDVAHYFTLVETPEEAEAILIFMSSPSSDCYSEADLKNGGNGYMPISLQYRPYTAEYARDQSIGQGDYREMENPNRSYKDKVTYCNNESDLDNVIEMKQMAGNKPVIAVVHMENPFVQVEYEPYVDAIIVSFGTTVNAVFDILTGGSEPSGLLPVQLPANMRVVEEHCEDLPFDMACHVDTEGNTYDFGFGLNWSGVIKDERTKRYHSPNQKV